MVYFSKISFENKFRRLVKRESSTNLLQDCLKSDEIILPVLFLYSKIIVKLYEIKD